MGEVDGMTRLEKAKELHLDYTDAQIIYGYCPGDLVLVKSVACLKDTCCYECWNFDYKEGGQS